MTAADRGPQRTGLSAADLDAVDAALAPADADRLARYPGDRTDRQPVHTVYVPADRVHADLAPAWGAQAREALRRHAAGPDALAAATGLPAADVADVWDLVLAKLDREPVEDLRVDLEDGYGTRPDAEEDADALAAGTALAAAVAAGTAPPYLGVRFKSLEAGTRRRGLRSLDLLLGALLADAGLPAGFVLTLPKVTSVAQVDAMVDVCRRLERGHGLPDGVLRFEIQVETPQAVLLADGTAGVAPMVHAAAGRCSGLHFGTYDYTAALGVAGGFQALDHPAADHAKAVLQLAAAGTGVRVSDGSTNLLPVGDRAAVHAGWARHARLVRRSLERGFYQGWDLHPAQLPTRYLSTYLFFRTGLTSTGQRLRHYLAGRADGGALDEPATAQALAAALVRGAHCGAVTAAEVAALTGADLAVVAALADRRVG
ncbi:HpcH/HpaI aldolase/citrate lyase family protein [Friedmanniella luteola]|uniref:HpcH/HpaI aldolase/citrate lyase family protein n=1 Tax=Friedmanniella luteola TaxID=546871 RepID=A0A1H1ZRV7_9ACTN|nr:aldolase/citrate lyase family protein [Friedmanniella luteola]SDT36448.1 HpcH/HpaI aldolase/citrate lyase family protein [Friedmanniella luteola]